MVPNHQPVIHDENWGVLSCTRTLSMTTGWELGATPMISGKPPRNWKIQKPGLSKQKYTTPNAAVDHHVPPVKSKKWPSDAINWYNPLVNSQIANWKMGDLVRGFTHETWWIFPLFFLCLPEGIVGDVPFSDSSGGSHLPCQPWSMDLVLGTLMLTFPNADPHISLFPLFSPSG